DKLLRRANGVLRLTQIRPFTSQPEDDERRIERAGDIDAALGAIERVGADGGVVGGKRAVDGIRTLPEARRDEFGGEASVGDLLAHGARPLADLRGGEVV